MSALLQHRVDLTQSWKPIPKRLDLTTAFVWKNAIITNVHDGDTVTVNVDLGIPVKRRDQPVGFHISIESAHAHYTDAVRLYGLNAPELITPEGKKSQQALAGQLSLGTAVTLTTWLDRNDKYGRILGNIVLGATDINQWLIDNHWALPWDGHGVKPV